MNESTVRATEEHPQRMSELGRITGVFWSPGTASALDATQIAQGRDVGANKVRRAGNMGRRLDSRPAKTLHATRVPVLRAAVPVAALHRSLLMDFNVGRFTFPFADPGESDNRWCFTRRFPWQPGLEAGDVPNACTAMEDSESSAPP